MLMVVGILYNGVEAVVDDVGVDNAIGCAVTELGKITILRLGGGGYGK